MRDPAHSECITNGYGFCSIDLSPTTSTSPDSGISGAATTSEMQDVSGDPDWSSTLTAIMLGPGPEIPFPTTTSTSTSTSTYDIPALSSSAISESPVWTNPPSTSQQPPSTVTSSSPSSPLPAPSAASPSHRHGLPTPALAGAIASAVLAVAVAAALVYRRRCAHTRALLPRQNTAIADHAFRLTTQRVGSKHQGADGVQEDGTSTSSLGSDSSRGALDGSAETLACSPSSSSRRTPTLTVDVDNKHRESSEPELPSHGPSPSLLPALPRSPVAPEIEEIEGAPSHSERILRFELPWVLGQRVLAVIAREDARGESGVEEPLPAYEPHG